MICVAIIEARIFLSERILRIPNCDTKYREIKYILTNKSHLIKSMMNVGHMKESLM